MGKGLVVVKANSLIEASYRLSLDEIRVLALTVGTMDPNSAKQVFDFTVSDVVREFSEIKIENAYKQIQIAIKKLYDRTIRTEDCERVTDFRWVSSRTYFKKEGRFRIALTNEIMPYLTQLKGQFTQYQLRNISSFNSVHSIRIYELCMQYKVIGEREILVVDLKKWMQIEDKYPRYNSFNQRVLEPAVKEINDKSDIFISIEPIKRGRSVNSIRFIIKQIKKTDKQSIKSGRLKLPHRPQVKSGTSAEGDWAIECINKIKMFWCDKYSDIEWRKTWKLIPVEELEKLYNFYKIIGDSFACDDIKNILKGRAK